MISSSRATPELGRKKVKKNINKDARKMKKKRAVDSDKVSVAPVLGGEVIKALGFHLLDGPLDGNLHCQTLTGGKCCLHSSDERKGEGEGGE